MINAVHDTQERALRAQQICEDILKNTRNQLYLNMQFLDNALAQLYPAGDMEFAPLLEVQNNSSPYRNAQKRQSHKKL